MGMYDTIYIDDADFPELAGRPLQTKDFDKTLSTYRIADSRLYEGEMESTRSGTFDAYDFDPVTYRWEEWRFRTENGIVLDLMQTKSHVINRVSL